MSHSDGSPLKVASTASITLPMPFTPLTPSPLASASCLTLSYLLSPPIKSHFAPTVPNPESKNDVQKTIISSLNLGAQWFFPSTVAATAQNPPKPPLTSRHSALTPRSVGWRRSSSEGRLGCKNRNDNGCCN